MPRPRGTHLLRRLVLIDFVILIVWARKSRPSLSDSIDSIQLRALHETSSESLAHIRAGTVRGARCRCRRRHRPLDVVPEMRSAVASNATASRRGRDRVRGYRRRCRRRAAWASSATDATDDPNRRSSACKTFASPLRALAPLLLRREDPALVEIVVEQRRRQRVASQRCRWCCAMASTARRVISKHFARKKRLPPG